MVVYVVEDVWQIIGLMLILIFIITLQELIKHYYDEGGET